MLRFAVWFVVCAGLAASALAEPPAAKDYFGFWGPTVGNWKIAIQAGDKSYEGEWKLQPADNQTCLQGQANLGGLVQASTLEGFDPETRCWKRIWFDAQGGCQLDRVTIDDVKRSKLQAGTVVRVDTSLVAPDGRKTSHASRWRFAAVEPDKLEVVVSQGPLGPEATLTLTRIK